MRALNFVISRSIATRNLYDVEEHKISPFGRNDIIDGFSGISRYKPVMVSLSNHGGLASGHILTA
jgi:hypothetical protein